MFGIKAWDHAGVRVYSLERSLKFYERLGFHLELDHEDGKAYEIVNEHGIRLNLIVNAAYDSKGENILLDEAVKHPGVTHPAFIVDDLEALTATIRREGFTITEGPNEALRRRYLFIRDPDGNVLEFNELKQ
jgi:catechol 2,3-dioxygenase-like lactoylglutathione lyase family enzyme